MSNFTKGKWIYDDETNYIFDHNKQMPIAQIRGWEYLTQELGLSFDEAYEVHQANARLAAAAPEMYKLLEEANQIFYLWRRTNNDEDERRSVIDEINERYKDFEINSMNLLARIDNKEHEELCEAEAQA